MGADVSSSGIDLPTTHPAPPPKATAATTGRSLPAACCCPNLRLYFQSIPSYSVPYQIDSIPSVHVSRLIGRTGLSPLIFSVCIDCPIRSIDATIDHHPSLLPLHWLGRLRKDGRDHRSLLTA
ncbi:hypothetical protein XPA_007643 [Xanthoria parietina]